MRSIARLWRRAPAWRFLLVVAVGCTGLAAMFPPATPRWALAVRHRAAAADMSGELNTRFVPMTNEKLADYATTAQPPPGPPRSGVIPFGGRQLPLPSGGWQTLELGRAAAPANIQVHVFGRIADNALTGVIFATAPDVLASGIPPALVLEPCATAGTLISQTAALVADNPLARECWTLGSTGVSPPGEAPNPGDVALSDLHRLTKLGVTIPRRMLALRYSRSDQNGWFAVMLLIPDREPRTAAATHRLQVWARGYAAWLHKGYDRILPALSSVPQALHDPD